MDFTRFLIQQGIIIAAVLYIIGTFLKRTPFVPDWLIPYILTVLGAVAAGFTMAGGFTAENIFQGIFAAGAAVLTDQMQKQASLKSVGDAFAAVAAKSEPSHDEGAAAFAAETAKSEPAHVEDASAFAAGAVKSEPSHDEGVPHTPGGGGGVS